MGTATAVGLKRTREAEQEAYRRCKTVRQTDPRVMLAGPKGRAVGESGELDTGGGEGKGLWGVESTLAVIGTGGPVK